MKRKIIVIVSALAAAAVLFCALVPCVGGLTPFQASGVKRFFKNDPFLSTDPENHVSLPIAAAVGANGYERNTFVGSRVQMESGPAYIEVNLASDDSGRLVLADSYFDTSEESIDVYRVAKSLLQSTQYTSLLVNLTEFTNLNAASTLLAGEKRFQKAVVRGVDETTLDYVRGWFSSQTVLCDYSRSTKSSLAQLKAKGADGVYCSASMLSTRFAKKVHDAGLLLWVDCGGSARLVIKTMRMAQSVDGLVTTKLDFALAMQRQGNYEDFMRAVSRSAA